MGWPELSQGKGSCGDDPRAITRSTSSFLVSCSQLSQAQEASVPGTIPKGRERGLAESRLSQVESQSALV